MRLIDSHIHCFPEPDLSKEITLSEYPVNKYLKELSQKLKKNQIDEAVVYILDERVLLKSIEKPNNLILGCIIGIHDKIGIFSDAASKKGIKIIKLLPYEQKITRDKFDRVIDLATYLSEKKMVLTICSTYGSKFLFDTNGPELAAYIKKYVDIPIILAHGGGPKVFDAMSLALSYDDIYLDTSFSLIYWSGSSVIQDFAFALKKLECERIFYGSDYPNIGFDESLTNFKDFLRTYNFSMEEEENLLFNNFCKFKQEYL